jgi:hypothetical protein
VFIIGRLSPMIFKSAKEIGSHPGKAISKYWLINTAGGLFGIFSLNFLLIAWLNLTTLQILTILAALCLLAAARARWHFFLALLVAALIPFQSSTGALHFETVFGSFYLREKVMQLGSFGSHLVRVLKFSQNRVSAGVILDTEHKTDLMFYNFDMRWAWAMNPNIRKVLILGFGSGAFARDLKKDAPDLDVTIVDLDAKLKDVAHDYFFYPKEPNDIEEVFDDARFFLQKSKFFYDLIIFDIYDSLGHPPTNSVSLEFFNLVRSRLSSSGIFAMNLFAAKPTNEHMTISGSVLRTMQEAFGVKPTTLLPIWRWTELAPFRDGRKENLLVFMISDFIVDKMDFDSIYTRFPNLNKNLNQFNGSIWENLAIEMQYGDHPVLVDQKNPSDMFEKNISLFNGVN